MGKLHRNQVALLDILEKNVDNPLTIREIQEELNLSSPSVVAHHLQKLEQKGYLKRNPNNSRDYQILSNPENPVVYMNLYGFAQCGINGSILEGNPIDCIPISSKLLRFPSLEGFMVTAKGDSMEPFIKSGDLVIVQKKANANDGDTIVCVLGENVLIKKYFHQKGKVTLISNNHKHAPILVNDDYFKIEGVVKNVIKYS